VLHSWHYLPLGLANLLIAHYIRTVFTTSNIPMPCNIKSLNKSPLCWQTIEFTKQKFGMIGAKSPLIVHSWMSQTNCIPYYPLDSAPHSSTILMCITFTVLFQCGLLCLWARPWLSYTHCFLLFCFCFVFFCFVLFCFVFCFLLFCFCFVVFFLFVLFCFVFCFLLFCFCFVLFLHTNICTIKAKAT